ncbi:helix-turn-helix domain-containing protein [Psychromarinibacter halotolerans]|uniref:Helix-turn-helix domain-containing protein n=1 Tax=Psychromarinibacter halotolerans TaxID=1775175 RepID=A0ABV7GVW8_9RHOB|nr:helix-turn-helix domain-containing protein [Psychromarinibacter halotolerans]MDF0596552.1 helix-turn-helix domain-containing protein [Psychromarinibacter halotolerans]
MEKEIPNQLATLGHPQRLAIFRLLMRRYPDELPAGEIAQVLDVKASTLSAYLNALMGAGLVAQNRVGTSLRYAIDMKSVQGMFGHILNDCCRGRPDLCIPVSSAETEKAMTDTDQKYNVLFICTGNSARSIFAETILREIAGDRFNAYSAGTRPTSELNPFAVDLLRHKGHDITPLRSKNIQEFAGEGAPRLDFVFTVCDRAANEECPAWTGQPISAHWSTQDPVKADGTDAEKSLAFQRAYGALLNRIRAFTALPITSLDRISLQAAVDDIARTGEGETA